MRPSSSRAESLAAVSYPQRFEYGERLRQFFRMLRAAYPTKKVSFLLMHPFRSNDLDARWYCKSEPRFVLTVTKRQLTYRQGPEDLPVTAQILRSISRLSQTRLTKISCPTFSLADV